MITLKGNKNGAAQQAMKKALSGGVKNGPLSGGMGGAGAAAAAPDKDLPLIKGKTEPVRDEESTKEQVADTTVDEESEPDDGDDDPIFAALRAQRMSAMQKKFLRQQEFLGMGHGQYKEIVESEFLNHVTKSKYTVCHFYHPDFERCKIVDKHLAILATKYLPTRFIYLNAVKSPFFVDKLKIQMLPTIVFFKDGIAVDRMVGFDDVGQKDDFTTDVLERRILKSGVIAKVVDEEKEEEEEESKPKNSIRFSSRTTASVQDGDSDDDA